MRAKVEPRRFGMVVRIKPARFDEFRKMHEAMWPGVLEQIKSSSVRNYSIYHKDGLLFAYFEYTGDDFEADMRLMAANLEVRRWWAAIEPMQDPLPTRAPGEWWARMEELFHTD